MVALDGSAPHDVDAPTEWLVTNGLGGYASGLVGPGVARRYHGLLIASLPAPLGRTLVLDYLRSAIVTPDGLRLLDHEHPSTVTPADRCPLREFRLDTGLPVWRFASPHIEIEKRIVMPHGHNTVLIIFRLVRGPAAVRMRLRPLAHVRSHDAPLGGELQVPHAITSSDHESDRVGIELGWASGLPQVRWMISGANARWHLHVEERVTLDYDTERRRGYEHVAELWSPGWAEVDLTP